MTRARAANSERRSIAGEVLAVVLIALAVLMLLSLVTYHPTDLSWNTVGPDHPPANMIGRAGAYLSDFFLQWFGLASLVIPLLLMTIAIRALLRGGKPLAAGETIGTALLLLAFSGFLALFPDFRVGMLRNARNGGALGYAIEGGLSHLMNRAGAAIVLSAASILTLMIAMDVSLIGVWAMASAAIRKRPARSSGVSADPAQPAAVRTETQTEPRAGPGALRRVREWWADRAESRKAVARRIHERHGLSESEPDIPAHKTPVATRRIERARPRDTGAAAAHEPISSLPGSNPVISPVITKSPYLTVDLGGSTARSRQPASSVDEPDGSDWSASQLEAVPEPQTKTPSTPRSDAQNALRARSARLEQAKSSEITMDPDVAEMISTASIVRTAPNGAPLSDLPKDSAERRKIPPKQAHRTDYVLPPLAMLETPISHQEQQEDELRERATLLAEKCKEFSVTGHIHRINPGPVVTTFEFKPDPGIKYSRVVSLADDLCLALKAESIRIDRIPGKSTVGIEVPNAHREKIYLREVIESPKFQKSESRLSIALGKTINGEEYIADLVRMPHLLIAGATGAGKSVTLNAIICSILCKASPEEVKLIMVDPKRLELGLYEGIPHLLTPIVTEPKKAANALKWATNEMENRYRELAKFGVRNIDQYNQFVRESPRPPHDDGSSPKPLPYIVITIDELADLMMVARGDVETSIARLAQMARAVGIHLVVATQRPSVDVITGVIKANFPSRIAFRVSSKVDSRTIIDSNGAEGLLGQGDMLFLPPASSRLVRVHGSFVNEIETKRITDHCRNQAKPDYNEEVTMSEQEAEGGDEMLGEKDELFEEAVAIVTDMGRASTSVLQRRLSIGYGRAAKILDLMERSGFIGPTDGAKPRKVLQAAYEFRERIGQIIEEREE
jgi:S-DNA-T family DNA segregation ATPase FtsK/SpoIIIE